MQENVSLNIADLRNLLSVVDYAAAQGAFKGWETINQVLQVREKLAAFVLAAQQAEEAQKAQQEEEELTFVSPEEAPVQAPEAPAKKRAKKA